MMPSLFAINFYSVKGSLKNTNDKWVVYFIICLPNSRSPKRVFYSNQDEKISRTTLLHKINFNKQKNQYFLIYLRTKKKLKK